MTRQAWTDEDNEKLKKLAGKISPKEIARQLNRSEGATRVQACKLGVKSLVVGTEVRRSVHKRPLQPKVDIADPVAVADAIERALAIYRQLHERDQSVVSRARKLLTQHIYQMVDQGERDERRLAVGGLIHLKAVEREHSKVSTQ